MAGQKGSDMLLKMDTAASGGPTFTTIAGLQTKQFSISSDTVDVTNADSSSKFRELLAGAGIKRSSVSGRGVFTSGTAEDAVRTSLLAGTIKLWQVVVPGDGTFEGLFQITEMEYSGAHDGEVQYDLRLESAGAITFTAA